MLEALNSDSNIERVIIAYNQKGKIIEQIIIAAKKRGVKISRVSAAKFKEYENTQNAQGVIGFASNLKFYPLEEILCEIKNKNEPLILALDSVQDPHNLGAILRTAEATAVDAIIVPLRNTAPFSETVEKASTGALNRLKICRVDNLAKTLDALKKENFWIVGTSLEAEKDFTELDYRMPVVIVLGNEGKGIRPSVLSRCDFLVKIPMFGKVQSLNVSVSAGVLLYEVIKQRKKKNE